MFTTIVLGIYALFSSVLLVHHEQKLNEPETVREFVQESVVYLEDASGKGSGTGFITETKKGRRVIVTNAHVCEMNPALPIFVVFHRVGNTTRVQVRQPTTVIDKYSKHDLCILAVPAGLKKTPALELADAAYLDEKVYMIGYPVEPLLSVGQGRIRGIAPFDIPYEKPILECVGEKFHIRTVPIKQEDGSVKKEQVCFFKGKFLFVDGPNDAGASGSPGLNASGEVVGVMSMVSGRYYSYSNLVPLESLKDFLSKY